jgi:hypothetical protein
MKGEHEYGLASKSRRWVEISDGSTQLLVTVKPAE